MSPDGAFPMAPASTALIRGAGSRLPSHWICSSPWTNTEGPTRAHRLLILSHPTSTSCNHVPPSSSTIITTAVAITFFFPILVTLAEWVDALGPYLLVVFGAFYVYLQAKTANRPAKNSDGARHLSRSTDKTVKIVSQTK